jgi:hypothetical protein
MQLIPYSFSFLQHLKWEKFKTIFTSDIINSWGIAGLMRSGSWSIQILIRPHRRTTFPEPLLIGPHRRTTFSAVIALTAFGPEPLLIGPQRRTTCQSHNIHSSILSFQLLCNSFIPFFHSYNIPFEPRHVSCRAVVRYSSIIASFIIIEE